MSIDHLDFATPDVPDLPVDEHGVPLFDGKGRDAWLMLVDHVNRSADDDGWDAPAGLWTINSPTRTAAELAEHGVTPQQALRDLRGVEVPDDMLLVSYGASFQGSLDAQTLDSLWGADTADVPAILLSREAWYTPADGVTIPAGAWREDRDVQDKKSKKKDKRARSTASDARVEVRIWTVVTRSGASFSRTYARTGKRQSKAFHTGEARGLGYMLLSRMFGRTVPPHPECVPATVAELLAVDAAYTGLAVAADAGKDPTVARNMTAVRLLTCSDPLRLPFTPEDIATLSTGGGDVNRMDAAADIVERAFAGAELPTWVQAVENGPTTSSLFPVGFPPAKHAAWAGEEMLALLAGSEVQQYRDELPALAGDAGMLAAAQVRAVLQACNLPLPAGL